MKQLFHGAAVWLLLAILNAHYATASAQGTAFTYQGQLQNSSGPVNGSYDLTFSLYNTNINGTAIAGPVTNSAVPVTNGLFTTLVNFEPGAFTGTSNWLAIAVRPNGSGSFTNLSPRQQITPTPYAIYSASAASASSVPAADVSGTLGLGQLPAAVITNNDSSANLSGTFTGNGASLTNIPLTGLASGGSLGLTTNGYAYILAGTYGVGLEPFSITAATNLSGAGYVDLVVPNAAANKLSVLTNNGTGGFVAAPSPTTGASDAYSSSVAVMDVNNDGKPDLISVNNSTNTLIVLTNSGEARFGSNATLVVGLNPVRVIAADMNGDGKLDLISANFGTNTLSVLTNNGGGKFGLYATLTVGTGPYDVVSADVNKDGKLDLISANSGSNTVTVLINNGNGTFLPATYATGSQPLFVVAVDVNGDGWVDLVCGSSSGVLTVLTNNQNGTFTLASTNTLSGQTYSMAVADVNGDGKPDLICANVGGSLQEVLNTGNGTFALGPELSPSGAMQLVGVTAADVTGNGKLDLLAADIVTSSVFDLRPDNGAVSTELTLPGQSGGLSLSPGLNGVPNLIGGSSANVVGSSVTGSVIAGGGSPGAINQIFADYSGISGGEGNSIEAGSEYSSIGGGYENIILDAQNAFIGGGFSNTNSGYAGTISGGINNVVTSVDQATVGGGYGNTASGNYATVGGGAGNIASGDVSTVAGGGSYDFFNTLPGNMASGEGAVVGGGGYDGNYVEGNVASGDVSVIGGGLGNTNNGYGATVPGGVNNVANGDYSFAAGLNANANNNGSFVWADSQNSVFADTGNNQFLVRAKGGVGINTNNPSAGMEIAWGGGLFSPQLRLDQANNDYSRLRFAPYTNTYWDIAVKTSMNLYANGGANGGNIMTLTTNGNVGIGTTAPDALLSVNGSVDKPGGGSWGTFSDGRLKDVGADFTHGLEALSAIQPVHYHYKADNALNLPSQPDYVGVVAQQVQSAIPEAVHQNRDGYLVVNNDPIIWTMFNGIKELNQKLEAEDKAKDAEIRELKAKADKVDALEKQLNELEATVNALAGKK